MKTIRNLVMLVPFVLMSGTCLSENLNDSIIQPGQVIGRHLDAAGNIDNELTSQFSYHENGKVKKFDFPDYVLSTSFHYDGDFMKKEFTYHRAGYPEVEECLDYDYDEKGLLVSMSHTWSLMESNQYWSYQYNGEGRLVRKELGDGHDTWEFWLYDYEEDGHKRTESHYLVPFIGHEGMLSETTQSTYDGSYRLVEELTTAFNDGGESTGQSRTEYTYHQDGNPELKTTQTLTANGWANHSFVKMQYDGQSRLTEWASGSWSESDQAWEEERKAVYEYDDAGMKEVVSFYKKSGEEWIRDKFTNHPLFINPAEKWQQNSMRFYYYETYFHEGNVNQFEIRYIYTEAPVYLSEPENKEHVTGVFPNPGTDHVKVSAGVDNAVVRFYDLQGRLRDARPFDFSTTINAGGWPSGVYLWEIWRDDQKLGSGKWVKN